MNQHGEVTSPGRTTSNGVQKSNNPARVTNPIGKPRHLCRGVVTKQLLSRLALPFAVFGFMLIIATGFNMLLGRDTIPLFVSIIGLIFVVFAMVFRKKAMM